MFAYKQNIHFVRRIGGNIQKIFTKVNSSRAYSETIEFRFKTNFSLAPKCDISNG